MKQVVLSESLGLKLLPSQRRAIEWLAARKALSLGEAARLLLDEGIRAQGINFEQEERL